MGAGNPDSQESIFAVLPGLVLLVMFCVTALDSTDPDYGSGSSLFGVGTVFILGMVVGQSVGGLGVDRAGIGPGGGVRRRAASTAARLASASSMPGRRRSAASYASIAASRSPCFASALPRS